MDLQSAVPVALVSVLDRERAIAFYTNVLGLSVKSEDPFGLFLQNGPALIRMTKIPDHKPGPHAVLGWHVGDVRATAKMLTERGATFNIYGHFEQDELGVWTAPDGTRVAWFNDSEGNVLSLSGG